MNDFLQSLRNGQAEKPRTPKTRKNSDNSYHYTSSPKFPSHGGYQNTRNQQMKRPPMQHQPGNQMPMDETPVVSLLADAIENLSSHIETLTKNQDYLITAQERTADMLERQAIALERVVGHLNIALAPETSREQASEPENPFRHHYVTSREPEQELKPELDIPEPVETPVETNEPVKAIIRKKKKVVAKKTDAKVSTGTKLLSREAVMDIVHTMRAEGATFDQVASRLVELGQPTFSGRGEWHAQTIHRLCNKK
ncbi:MAG: hypothetical protein KAH09_08490 [Desulfobacula sp.]|nr:hypothetical protein [Desulfobacula sp.]